MQNKHILSLLQTGYTTVQARFQSSGRLYTYKAKKDQVKKGDHAVVNAPGGLAIVEIIKVDKAPCINVDAPYNYKWLVQKVDLSEYNQVVALEVEFNEVIAEVERERKKEELLNSFNKYLKPGTKAHTMFNKAITKNLPRKRIGNKVVKNGK